MRGVILCESSGRVRSAFRAMGHEFYSCDLKPSEDGGPHFQQDALEVIRGGGWEFIGAHPECRYLTVSGMHRTVRGLRDPKLTEDAIKFCEAIWEAIQACGRGYLENSIGVLSTRSKLGKPTQIIQPYNFGEDASKFTCLWLCGLPPLQPTMYVKPRIVAGKKRWANQTDGGQNRLAPSEHRSADRARTYKGIAQAMSAQWNNVEKIDLFL